MRYVVKYRHLDTALKELIADKKRKHYLKSYGFVIDLIPPEDLEKIERCICPVCGKRLSTRASLASHMIMNKVGVTTCFNIFMKYVFDRLSEYVRSQGRVIC